MTTVHERRICLPCEEVVRTGGEVQLYSFGFNDGHCVSIAHGCEHLIREGYPGIPQEWFAGHAVEAVEMVNGQLESYPDHPTKKADL